jgi:hypothetical protein
MCGLKNNTVLKSCEIRAPATTHILQLRSHAESRRARSLLISNSRVVVTLVASYEDLWLQLWIIFIKRITTQQALQLQHGK